MFSSLLHNNNNYCYYFKTRDVNIRQARIVLIIFIPFNFLRRKFNFLIFKCTSDDINKMTVISVYKGTFWNSHLFDINKMNVITVSRKHLKTHNWLNFSEYKVSRCFFQICFYNLVIRNTFFSRILCIMYIIFISMDTTKLFVTFSFLVSFSLQIVSYLALITIRQHMKSPLNLFFNEGCWIGEHSNCKN